MSFAAASLMTGIGGVVARASGEQPVSHELGEQERKDRMVDQAAISAYEAAIKRMKVLAERKKGTRMEAPILLRLAETYHKAAGIQYRLVYGLTAGSEVQKKIGSYNQFIRSSLEPLNDIITRFPSSAVTARAYFIRARTYKELGNQNAAVRDLHSLIHGKYKLQEVASAYFMMFELLSEEQKYEKAIGYLEALKAKPADPYYTLVMDRLAWTNYYLGRYRKSLEYVERQVDYYRQQRNLTKPMQTELERVYSNAALYYGAAVEKNVQGFDVRSALVFFQGISRHFRLGASKMLSGFSYYLRTHGQDERLKQFADLVTTARFSPSDKVEVLHIVLGHYLNRNAYPDVIAVASRIRGFLQEHPESLSQVDLREKLEDTLSEWTGSLQSYLVNGQQGGQQGQHAHLIAKTLSSLYFLHLAFPDLSGPETARLRYNLAETSFLMKSFEEATYHYRKVVEMESPDLRGKAEEKAIAARYEVLKKMGIIPDDLQARNIAKVQARKVPAEGLEWIRWIEKAPEKERADIFEYEAARFLYHHDHVQRAVLRLVDFVKRKPASKYAIPAAALVIDTYLVSNLWSEAYRLANAYLQYPPWRGDPFHKRLSDVAADTALKLIEEQYQAKRYAEVIRKSEFFLSAYPSSRHRDSVLGLAANSALTLQDRQKALEYFTLRNDKGGAAAELTKGTMSEEELDFAAASSHYRNFVLLSAKQEKSSPEDLRAISDKTLMLSFLSGEDGKLARTLSEPLICKHASPNECGRFSALVALQSTKPGSARKTSQYLSAYRSATAEEKSIWALAALKSESGLSFEDRILLMADIHKSWGELSSLYQYPLLPDLIAAFDLNLSRLRDSVRKNAKIYKNQDNIEKRIQQIEKLESGISPIASFPVPELGAATLNTIAGAYADFYIEMDAIQAPKGLNAEDLQLFEQTMVQMKAPFREKGESLRSEAFHLASSSAVNEMIYDPIYQSFILERPAEANPIIQRHSGIRVPPLGSGLLNVLEADQKWQTVTGSIPFQFMKAIKSRQWARAGFLLQSADEKRIFRKGILEVAQAVAFAEVGAQSLAIPLLELSRRGLAKPDEARVLMSLAQLYYGAMDKEKAKKRLEELSYDHYSEFEKIVTRADAPVLANAIEWSGASVRSSLREKLQELSPGAFRSPAQEERL